MVVESSTTTTSSMKNLAQTEIPDALNELGAKHRHIEDIIQWAEASYQTGDKKLVQAQTKEYIVDALDAVTKEIEATSGKLMQFLTMQNEAIDSMTTQLEIVKERLAVAKDNNAFTRLKTFRKPVQVERRNEKSQIITDEERDIYMPAAITYEKDLDARFKRFDQIGTRL
mmetsp:Transcript_16376/g.21396  ORF Transcript_16376/g.21396 Transcript_16376/m.21396 type:complete len:170 (+) Transcript_16376:65-574(+)